MRPFFPFAVRIVLTDWHLQPGAWSLSHPTFLRARQLSARIWWSSLFSLFCSSLLFLPSPTGMSLRSTLRAKAIWAMSLVDLLTPVSSSKSLMWAQLKVQATRPSTVAWTRPLLHLLQVQIRATRLIFTGEAAAGVTYVFFSQVGP